MNRKISQEKTLELLNLLEKEIINENQVYEIVKLDEDKVEDIINILTLEGIEEIDDLIEKLKRCENTCNIYWTLTENPILRKFGAKRDFVIENSKCRHMSDFAKLIKYDFIFEDKDLLKSLLDAAKTQKYIYNLTEPLTKTIENNPEFYMDGSKNRYIKQAFQITGNDISIYQTEFVKLINSAEIIDNPKWFDYIKDCCNQTEYFDMFNWRQTYRLLNAMEKQKERLDQKLQEIDEKEIKHHEKVNLFSTFLDRVTKLRPEIIEKDNYFDYIMKFILSKKEVYEQHEAYIELFQEEDSVCKEGSECYRVLFSKFYDIKGGKYSSVKRYLILRVLKTSLKSVIDLDFVKKHKFTSYPKLKKVLLNLALQHEAMDYLERYHEDYLKKKEKIENPFYQQFIESTNNNSMLTKEELLELRTSLQLEMQETKEQPKRKYKKL